MRFARLVTAALVGAAAAVALAGCGSDTSTFGPSSGSMVPPDTLFLATVNGAGLPVQVRNDAGGSVSISGGFLVMRTGTFAQRLTLDETAPLGGTATRASTSNGTYTISGTRIHFHASDGGEWDGTVSATRVDYSVLGNSGSIVFSFRQR